MTEPRRHPTSPYLLRRLRSYDEVRADRQTSQEGAATDGHRDHRPAGSEEKSDGDTGQ
jgi:hypothetical protein